MRQLAWAGVFALVFTCLAFLLAAPSFGYTRYVSLDETASWLALRKVEVRCLSAKEALDDFYILLGATGYVEGTVDRRNHWHPVSYTVLAPGICEAALDHVDELVYTKPDRAWAILAVTHESGHLRGHRWSEDEAKTERWALRHFVAVAVHLGIPEPQARYLLKLAVRQHRKLNPEYHDPRCERPWVDDAGVLRNCN